MLGYGKEVLMLFSEVIQNGDLTPFWAHVARTPKKTKA